MKGMFSIGLMISSALLLVSCNGDSSDSASDSILLEVNSTMPVGGASDVALDAELAVIFSESINCGSISSTEVTLTANADTVVGALTCLDSIVTFVPFSHLDYGTVYTATLSSSIGDGAGNALGEDYSWQFTTVALPKVESTIPVSDANEVELDAVLNVNFSKQIDCNSVSSTRVTLTAKGDTVAGALTCLDSAVTFVPSSDLDYEATYTVTLSSSISDGAGNALGEDYSWQFTTVALPKVESTTPVNDANEVELDAVLNVNFSKQIDCNSVSSTRVTLTAKGDTVAGALTCLGSTVTFVPSGNLDYETTYTVSLSPTISDGAGNALGEDYSWQFTTIALPKVESTIPVSDANEVELDVVLDVSFSKQIDCESISGAQVTLSANADTVAGVLSCSGSMVAFVPSSNLAYGTTYTAMLSSAIRDVGDNALGEDFSWQFTTVVDSESPALSISSHGASTVYQALPGEITLTGSASDNDAISSLSVSVNGAASVDITLVGDGTYSKSLELVIDHNELLLTASDIAGNSSVEQITINYVASGSLDITFGGDTSTDTDAPDGTPDGTPDGYISHDLSGSHDKGNMLVEAEDGTMFVAAQSRNPDYDMVLWRLKSDGSLDTASGFGGGNAYVTLDDPTGNAGGNQNDFANALALDTSGDVIVVGHAHNGTEFDLVVAKYDAATGNLDSSFGGDINPVDSTPDGFVVLDVSGAGSSESGKGVVIDDSNRIYVVGSSDSDLFVWKFTAVGVLDLNFGAGNGYVTYDSGGADEATDIGIDSDGNIIVSGSAGGLLLWKMNSLGETVTSFGSNGFASFASADSVGRMAFDSQSNIVVVGKTDLADPSSNSDMAIWRFTKDGIIDNTFGSDYDLNLVPDGYVWHDGAGGVSNADVGNGVAIDAADNVLVTGSTYGNAGSSFDFGLWRFTQAGVLDVTFGGDFNPADGIPDGFFAQNSAALGNNLDQGVGVGVKSDGKIVVVGESISSGSAAEMTVWQFN